MSLLRTPRGAGVKTRRQLMVENEAHKVDTDVKVASEMLKSECSRSTRTSSAARRLTIEAARKRAEVELEAIEAAEAARKAAAKAAEASANATAEAAAEAAAKKAAIRKSLIDMELNADLAELGSERSVMSSSEKVEASLDTTHVEATRREENATCTAPQQRTDIQELAAALTGAISNAAATNLNDQLLSRLATSKDLPIYYGDPLDWLQFRNAYYESTAPPSVTSTVADSATIAFYIGRSRDPSSRRQQNATNSDSVKVKQ
ncbi:tol-Pal system protein TolA-like [Ostrinia nubilalis]|uniref:tol-Pal system protein TolA-like n=1 Tax=Ostrinia nubilalis TaxID=29057 RepID=UPI003082275D